MSTRSSLAYKLYNEGIVHIYYEHIEEKYFITDERHGIVELPEKLAQEFSRIVNKRIGLDQPKKVDIIKRIENKRQEGEDDTV